MKRFLSENPYRVTRWLLGIIFICAGGAKLLDLQAFAVLIDSCGIVPDPLLMPTAVGLPLLEVVAAVGLVADVADRSRLSARCWWFSWRSWATGSGWDWMWIAAVSARKTRNPEPTTGFVLHYIASSIRKGEVAMVKGMLVGVGLVVGLYGQSVAADKFEEEFAWEKISIGLHNQARTGGYKMVGTEELKS